MAQREVKVVRRNKRQVIQKWIAALRSGRYKQVQGELRNGDSFCCLGVLCDLAAKDGGAQWSKPNRNGGMKYRGTNEVLPDVIGDFVGLAATEQLTLANMNDDGKSFRDIADYLTTFYTDSGVLPSKRGVR